MNKHEILENVISYINDLSESFSIDLIEFIGEELETEVTEGLLIYIWDNIKDIKGVQRKHTRNDIVFSINAYK
ncbi:hypothetical protein [Clostridium sp. VAP52]|uniref:hypothetical protein n=1 Tax=Clostridium sp. VAP52 TaxID=2949977 RepID=UPI0020793997|nr:hypothetical protein [Clostridium sp. VAP52]